MDDHLELQIAYKLKRFSVRPIFLIGWPLRIGLRWETTTGKTIIAG
jgi:hypothetical protein